MGSWIIEHWMTWLQLTTLNTDQNFLAEFCIFHTELMLVAEKNCWVGQDVACLACSLKQPVVAIDSILRRLDFSSLQQVRPMPRSFCQDIHAGNEWFLKQICRFWFAETSCRMLEYTNCKWNNMVPGPWWYSCCKPVFASGNLVIDFLDRLTAVVSRLTHCGALTECLWNPVNAKRKGVNSKIARLNVALRYMQPTGNNSNVASSITAL